MCFPFHFVCVMPRYCESHKQKTNLKILFFLSLCSTKQSVPNEKFSKAMLDVNPKVLGTDNTQGENTSDLYS